VIRVKDISGLIEDFAPLSFQESYDNSGLIIGNPEMLLTGVLVCLDITENVIEEAIKYNLNMIVSHHPLIFKAIKRISSGNRVDTCIINAIKNDIAIYAGHTNVDSVLNGVNGKISEKLGLSKIRILSQTESKTGDKYGLGVIGELECAYTEQDILKKIKEVFNCKFLKHSKLTNCNIKTVAVCGGSGSEFMLKAKEEGADLFLTGESSFHEYFNNDLNMLFVDAGHYETEQFTKEIFFDLISKKFPTFAVRISDTEVNPVHYF